jgi:hypothetical protein
MLISIAAGDHAARKMENEVMVHFRPVRAFVVAY